ncbi:hypothetical protein PTUN_a3652 [Pseudoalteromonas tunicata]|nr:hypothetical protein PTUN_a3652 [Pseudoalteromonas tunicata]
MTLLLSGVILTLLTDTGTGGISAAPSAALKLKTLIKHS